jgi:hypothetical protein
MKRYETFLDKHCGQPFANIEEDANGGLVMYDEAQAEIDAIKAQNAELLAALGWYGEHSRLARLITSEGDAGRNAIASDGGQKAIEAIAKARGES